jgi:hypothetical protein
MRLLILILSILFLSLAIHASLFAEDFLPPQERSVTVGVTGEIAGETDREESREERSWIEMEKKVYVTSDELLKAGVLTGASFVSGQKKYPFGNPVLVENGNTWFPLADVAEYLAYTYIVKDKDNFVVIRDDGLPLEIAVGFERVEVNRKLFATLGHLVYLYKNEPYIEKREMELLFDREFTWDALRKTLAPLGTIQTFEFRTFTKPKPPKPPSDRPVADKPPISPDVERFTEKRIVPAPASIKPDAKIHVAHYATYTHNNLTKKRKRTYALYAGGYVPHYKVEGRFRFEDELTGTLVNEEKFIGIYGKDHWIRALGLNTDLYPLRSQGEGYKGFEFTQFAEPFTARYYFGKTNDITMSGPAGIGAVKYYGNLAGVQNRLDLGVLDLKADVIYVEHEAEDTFKRGWVTFPRRNVIVKGDATARLPSDVTLATQYGFCNYVPDKDKHQVIRDFDWRVEAKIDKEIFKFRSVYEFVGTDYSSLGFPASYQDYEGLQSYLTIKPMEQMSFTTTYTASHNNVDDLDSEPTTDSNQLSFGTNLRMPDDSTVSLSWGRSYTQTTGPGQTYVEELGSYGYNSRISYSKSWAQNLSLYASYQRWYTDYFGSDNDRWSDTYTVSLYKFIPRYRGSYIRLRHQLRKSWYMASGNFTTVTKNTSLGIRFYPVPQLMFYADADLDLTESENISDTALLRARAGATLKITRDAECGIDYSFNPTDVNHFSKKDYNDWMILFRGSIGFDVGPLEKWAHLDGHVFIDENVNGVYDNGEPGVKDVLIKVPNEVMAMSDKKGHYHIKRLVPGRKIVRIDEKSVPFGFAFLGSTETTVDAGEYKTEKVDFPLIKVGALSGRLFADDNKNGTFEYGEEGLDFVTVYLNGTFRWTVTDENGNFSFEFLAPGDYTITFNADDIGVLYDMKSLEETTVHLPQGEKLENINIPIRRKEIVKKVF